MNQYRICYRLKSLPLSFAPRLAFIHADTREQAKEMFLKQRKGDDEEILWIVEEGHVQFIRDLHAK